MAFLTRFSTIQEYNAFISGNDAIFPNVSYVEETDTNNRHIHVTNQKFNFGDVLLYNTLTGIKFGVNINVYNSIYKNALYFEPQALCVIQTGLLPDIKARFIALTGVNENGTSSTSEKTFYWNQNNKYESSSNYSFLDTGLTNYTTIRTWATNVSDTSATSGSASNARVPIERSTGTATTTGFNTTSIINSYLKYYVEYTDGTISSTANYTQPLLLSDWTLNPAHFNNLRTTDYLNDYNGKSNTDYLVSISSESKPTYNSEAEKDYGYFQAAMACHRYSTSGFAAGQWYLPSIVELSVGFTRYDSINTLLSVLNGVSLVSSHYWSSTEYNTHSAVYFSTTNGNLCNYNKYNNNSVRPFLLF